MATAPNVVYVEPASADDGGFPMEIGLVLHNGAVYCLVTRPGREGFAVDPAAERTTGLTREIRQRRGRAAAEVAAELNRALGTDTVHYDARSDAPGLLHRVFNIAGMAPSFAMEPLQVLLEAERTATWERAADTALDEQRQIRNRASDKALVLQQTCLRTINDH